MQKKIRTYISRWIDSDDDPCDEDADRANDAFKLDEALDFAEDPCNEGLECADVLVALLLCWHFAFNFLLDFNC